MNLHCPARGLEKQLQHDTLHSGGQKVGRQQAIAPRAAQRPGSKRGAQSGATAAMSGSAPRRRAGTRHAPQRGWPGARASCGVKQERNAVGASKLVAPMMGTNASRYSRCPCARSLRTCRWSRRRRAARRGARGCVRCATPRPLLPQSPPRRASAPRCPTRWRRRTRHVPAAAQRARRSGRARRSTGACKKRVSARACRCRTRRRNGCTMARRQCRALTRRAGVQRPAGCVSRWRAVACATAAAAAARARASAAAAARFRVRAAARRAVAAAAAARRCRGVPSSSAQPVWRGARAVRAACLAAHRLRGRRPRRARSSARRRRRRRKQGWWQRQWRWRQRRRKRRVRRAVPHLCGCASARCSARAAPLRACT